MLKSCILDGCQEHEFMSVLEAKIKPLFIYIYTLKYVVLSLDNPKSLFQNGFKVKPLPHKTQHQLHRAQASPSIHC